MQEKQDERGPPTVMQCIVEAVSTMTHGEIVLVIHDGRIVRVDTTNKTIFKK